MRCVKGKPTIKFTVLKTRRAERLIDELDKIQRRITERAYEIIRNRGTFQLATEKASGREWTRPRLVSELRARGSSFGTVCQNGD